jgi:hypothetical protein
MKYEVFVPLALAHHLKSDILCGDHAGYYSNALATFEEVHVAEFCPHSLARLGLSHKVILDLSWVNNFNDPYREIRIKRLVGYLDRYSSAFNQAFALHTKMVVCNMQIPRCFFEEYIEMMHTLGSKMQIC